MMEALRTQPPREIAGHEVTGWEDLRDEEGRLGPLKGATDAASRNMLTFRLGGQARLTLRPSGTEPKAKIYIETSTPPCRPGTTEEAWQAQCQAADELAKQLAEAFIAQAMATVRGVA